jgi:membrane protein DedA with SNARE-associated domain/rhodanese-related sulfurtransferase
MDSFPQPGYSLLFAWVLAEQAGLPTPAVPMLLAAGAMAANGRIHFVLASAVALLASMIADAAWYEAGRRRGLPLLHSLCRISLERDSCARRTEQFYGKYGAFALVIAKFVPGLHFAAPPLSGVFRMKRWRFLLFNAVGAAAWILVFMSLGLVLRTQLNEIARMARAAGHSFQAFVAVLVLGGFAFWKYQERRRFQHAMRAIRITPEELKLKIQQSRSVAVIDVRHPLDVLSEPFIIPGAIRVPLEEIEVHPPELPRETEIVIYCTCPSQASSSRAWQLLEKHGFHRVRVLEGGLQGWQSRGFAVEKFPFRSQAMQTLKPIWAF